LTRFCHSATTPSGDVMTRFVNPALAAVNRFVVIPAAKTNSLG
jgi:hypothetical protein